MSQANDVEKLLEKNQELQDELLVYAKELEKRDKNAKQYAYIDSLTGLMNRNIFYKTLEHALGHANRYKEKLAVLFINLDKFKTINETYGIEAGDALLAKFSKRLKDLLWENDYVARLGADEFAVLMERLEDADECAVVSQKINDIMAEPFEITKGIDIHITTSIGIAIYPTSGQTAEELLQNADSARVKAKEVGHNGFQYYSEEYDIDARHRLSLEKDLREALEKQQFELHYQPIYTVEDRKICGAEALLRWKHPDHGMVSPLEFIPIAEKSGLIVPIGKWVMNEACSECVRIRKKDALVPISINLSAKQFREATLRQTIKDIIYEKDLDPRYLCLELTEGTLIEDVSHCNEILTSLTNIGVRISVDDFGTGYSSLTYIKDFPIHTLKIDKKFIDHLVNEDQDRNIVRFIIDLAHNLNMDVVAEGVETEEQFNLLQQMKCNKIQGYYLSKPLPAEEFQKLLLEK